MGKERIKQEMNTKAVTPKTEQSEQIFDATYWASFNKDNVAPPEESKQKETSERQQEIEKLYPIFTREKIPLDKLVPAKESWNFFPEQNRTALDELMKNIVAYGQISPAVVWEQEDGTYMILGGHTRFQAIKQLYEIFTEGHDDEQKKRFETMDCNVYAHNEIDEIEARKIIIYDNVIRRDNTTAIKARAVINMARLEKETRAKRKVGTRRERAMESISRVLDESAGTVKGLYRLRTLIPEFWPMIDAKGTSERITIQLAKAIASLEPPLQAYIFKKKLYLTRLSAMQLSKLKASVTTDEIDDIYNNPDIPPKRIAKVELNDAIPEDYETIVIACSKDEVKFVKSIIEWNVCDSREISEKTKDLTRKILNL